MKDKTGRKIDYLRLSITDRCNLRCTYCMGNKNIQFLPKEEILTPDEIKKIVEVFTQLGINKIRITGGEPLVRRNFQEIIRKIRSAEKIKEISITTNGIDLEKHLEFLKEMNITSINISIDSLNPVLYSEMTGGGDLNKVLNSIKKAMALNFTRIKINTVVIKGKNDNEIMDLVELAEKYPLDIRFIELMPIGVGKEYERISNDEIIKLISQRRTLVKSNEKIGSGPAVYYKTEKSKGNIGFINPISHNFCESCNRIRITPEGFLKLCLHSKEGIDLKKLVRSNYKTKNLRETIKEAIGEKPLKHRMDESNNQNFDDRLMNKIGG